MPDIKKERSLLSPLSCCNQDDDDACDIQEIEDMFLADLEDMGSLRFWGLGFGALLAGDLSNGL